MRLIIANKSSGMLYSLIILLSYAFLILSYFTGVSSIVPQLRIASMCMIVVVGLFYFAVYKKILHKSYVLWGVIFSFALIVSLLYAPNFGLAWNGIFNFISIFVPILIMIQTIRNNGDIEILMNMILVAGVSLSIVSIIFFQEQLFSAGRFSAVGNPNAIMSMLLLPCFILIYKIFTQEDNRLINALLLSLCFLVILFTGSRKGLLIPLIFILVFITLNNRKKILKRIIFTGIVFAIVYYLIFHVPELYIALGRRVELFYVTLFDSSNVEYFSDYLRIQFRKDAFNMFLMSPIIGHGVNSFATLYGTYSHNNYTEILSATGILGFCSYYWIHINSLMKLLKSRKMNVINKNYCDFAISIIIACLIFDWGGVSYNTLNMILSIALCTSIAAISIRKG